MAGTLIMPKQTGKKDAFYSSLQLYYESYKRGEEWYSNSDFKIRIQELLPYLSRGAQDGPYLVKQSELTRYFGLVYYDYSHHIGRAKITDSGIRFYNAYLQNDDKTQIDIIMNAIFNNSFGRNNTAIKSSDSDVDAPKLFFKSMYDLGSITRKGLAYLLYVTHDLQIEYNDAISELNKSNDFDREIPIEVANKYGDVKFTVLLNSLGIVDEIDRKYKISDYVLSNYSNKIKKLFIYNKKPDLILTLNENELENEIDTDGDVVQDKVISAFTYDIASQKFYKQNNRLPETFKRGNTIRYKTNARIAKTALHLANYTCEINPEHKTFISKLGKPYMEAHHLIPMAYQKDFSINIDRIENIVSICPICHSAIHLGNMSTRLELLKKLFDNREDRLKKVGLNISFGELFAKYYQ